MPKETSTGIFSARWSILWYGLALGILLVGLQVAQYRLLWLQAAREWYIGLIALLFTALGIWAGLRLTGRNKPEVRQLPNPSATPEDVLRDLGLTPREYDVLVLIAQGFSNQEIAGQLYVSLNTVKTHTSNIFEKLDVRRRTQAVEKARALGLLADAHPKV